MIQLIRGNRESLMGKATIYASLQDCGEISDRYPESFKEGGILLKYITSNPSEFPKKSRRCKRMIEVCNLLKELHLNPGGFPYFSSDYDILPLNKKIKIGGSLEDIVYVGRFDDITSGVWGIFLGEKIYLRTLFRQMELESKRANKENIKIVSKPGDLGENELEEYILKRYILPIISSKNKKDSSSSRLKRDLLLFLNSPHYSKDADEIIKIFDKERMGKTDKFLVDSIVRKICAIRSEDYVLAGKIHQDILSLKKRQLF